MKHRLYFILPFVGLLMQLSACNNFLEEVNPNKISNESYWKNLDQTQAGLNTVYAALYHHDLLAVQEEALRSDLAYPGYGRPSPESGLVDLAWYNQTFTPSTQSLNKKWEALYTGIFRANQVIEALKGLESSISEKDTQEWNTQMGQALFFRGLYHFYLHSAFNEGKIIIRDFVPKSQEDFFLPLSESKEVIAFFRNDLEQAYALLPEKHSTSVSDQGKITKGTAATILGTSYLYEKEYDQAITYFQDVINNSAYGYALEYDPKLLFTNAGELNKESIFEIVFSVDQRTDQGVWDEKSSHNRLARAFAPPEVAGGRDVIPSAWIAYAYKNEKMDTSDPRNQVTDTDGTIRLRKVPLRASSMVALVEDADTEFYKTTSAAYAIEFSNSEYAYYKKYINWDIYEAEDDSPLGVFASGKNITVNRLADVYLMYAEAQLLGNGNVEEALKMINRIRHRWALELLGTPQEFPSSQHDNKTYDVASLMEHIMYVEKPLEMSVEGFQTRTIDMRRWGIASERYQSLSEEIYHVVDYADCWINEEGVLLGREQASLVKGQKPEGHAGIDIIDYQQAAANFNVTSHSYLPLPTSEMQNNPAVGAK